jgi:hypothetical protein
MSKTRPHWRQSRSAARLTVDLFPDDVRVACVARGFFDDREYRSPHVAGLRWALHRDVGVADRGDDLVLRRASSSLRPASFFRKLARSPSSAAQSSSTSGVTPAA